MRRLLPRVAARDRDPGRNEVFDRAGDVPKSRKCLACRGKFQSEWAGQRVCDKCKKKTQWRTGAVRESF